MPAEARSRGVAIGVHYRFLGAISESCVVVGDQCSCPHPSWREYTADKFTKVLLLSKPHLHHSYNDCIRVAKIENDGDPWQPTCWLQMAHNDDEIQPVQLLPSRNIWRRISLTWPFPFRHCHARQAIDATKLLYRFCYWTLMWLSRHWAWLWQGYWCYRDLTDWLICS